MFDLLGKGFFLGLSLGTTCIVTCGPVLLPFILRDKKNLKNGLIQTFYFLSGRLLGYLLFGIIAGAIGMAIPDDVRIIIASIAYILLGMFLIYHSIRPHEKKICPAKGVKKAVQNPAILGFLTGINMCPPFALALGTAFESGGPIGGMILFSGFFFGSAIWFIPLAIFAGISMYKGVRIVARVIAGIVGLFFLVQGISGIFFNDNLNINISGDKAEEISISEDDIMNFGDFDTLYIVSSDSAVITISDSILRDRLYFDSIKTIALQTIDTLAIPGSSAVLHLTNTRGEQVFRDIAHEHNLFIVNAVISSDSEERSNSLEILADMLSHYYFKKNDGFYFITEPGDG